MRVVMAGACRITPSSAFVGKRQRDTGLAHLSHEQVLAGCHDKRLDARERRRYQREAKYRGLRNRRKRKG